MVAVAQWPSIAAYCVNGEETKQIVNIVCNSLVHAISPGSALILVMNKIKNKSNIKDDRLHAGCKKVLNKTFALPKHMCKDRLQIKKPQNQDMLNS